MWTPHFYFAAFFSIFLVFGTYAHFLVSPLSFVFLLLIILFTENRAKKLVTSVSSYWHFVSCNCQTLF